MEDIILAIVVLVVVPITGLAIIIWLLDSGRKPANRQPPPHLINYLETYGGQTPQERLYLWNQKYGQRERDSP